MELGSITLLHITSISGALCQEPGTKTKHIFFIIDYPQLMMVNLGYFDFMLVQKQYT